jgi:hypothetical protein
MAAVSLVATMKEVDQRAGQQEQIRQRTEDVGRVLGHQEEPGDAEKGEQHDTRSRPKPSTALSRWFIHWSAPHDTRAVVTADSASRAAGRSK